MMNVVVLKGLVSVINEFSAEMRKIEGTGISRAELMSTLKVLGADMSYLGHVPAAPVAPATPAAAPAAGKSVVNAPMPTKVAKPVVPQQRAQAPKAAVKAAPQPAPVAPVPAAAPATPAPAPAGKDYTVYTDGSFKNGAYGWAFAIYDGDKLIHSDKGGGTEPDLVKTRNIAGELKAAINAIVWVRHNLKQGDKVIIAYDYEGVEKWATSSWKANSDIAKKYVDFMAKYANGSITFHKVKGHSGVEGNEVVDKLAKEAVEAVLSEPAVEKPATAPAVEVVPVEETIPVPQEEAPAPAVEPAATPVPAVETTPVTPAEEKADENGMTTEEFNSQEPDPELQRSHDEMAKIQFDAIDFSDEF